MPKKRTSKAPAEPNGRLKSKKPPRRRRRTLRAVWIGLHVDWPPAECVACTDPLEARGVVDPVDVDMSARVVYPGGSVAGTLTTDPDNPDNPGHWVFSFPVEWSAGDPLALEVTATDGTRTVTEVVPFCCSAPEDCGEGEEAEA